MSKEKILIVDDEKPINDLIRSYLKKEGFIPISAYTGAEAIELLKKEAPDFIILDVMLPDIDGTSLCLDIRKLSDSPVLFLSCKSQEIDKIVALSAGGDDYMTKPFLPGELIARIRAHMRRQNSLKTAGFERDSSLDEEKIYTFPSLTINMVTHEVHSCGNPVNLTGKEFDILTLLVENPKRIFSAQQIFELTWKTSCLDSDARTVMVYISTIRKKIEINEKYILSIRGVGYKFNHKLMTD